MAEKKSRWIQPWGHSVDCATSRTRVHCAAHRIEKGDEASCVLQFEIV